MADVIAAIATAPGRGGIGVVRVSGPNLAGLASALLGRLPQARFATHAEFIGEGGKAIDKGIALYFPAPASYTGDDVLELQGHGGRVVMEMLLRRCVALGARLAEPGEFTRRAFLNDKVDLAQAEGVADLIDAATEVAARCALRSLRGDFSAVIDVLIKQVIELRMLVEASLDFPEEDIDTTDEQASRERLGKVRTDLTRALTKGRQGSVLRSGLQVVLAGQPNVGKSSLLNSLAGEDLAIVTAVPGTTRDAVKQTIQIDGIPLNIMDTAGLRDTGDEVEAIGMSRAWQAIDRADALLLVVEAAQGITMREREIIARLQRRVPLVIVFNKIDLSGVAAQSIVPDDSAAETHVWLSAKTGEGMDLLRSALLSIVGWEAPGEDVFLARERHLVALSLAADHLGRAEAVLAQTELFAEELRLAQHALCTITGEYSADDLLGVIFSRFCIGK